MKGRHTMEKKNESRDLKERESKGRQQAHSKEIA
jgi:hypothetical protein